MENKKETLDFEQLDKVSGGCILYCHSKRVAIGSKVDSNGVEHTYELFRCVDCGAERYKKDGEEVPPSIYIKEYLGIAID